MLSDRHSDRVVYVNFGVRRVSGTAGAQGDYSPVVQARPGDVLEFEVIASIAGSKPQSGAGVRFMLPKVPRTGHPVRADYLEKPGAFGSGDTVEVRPASRSGALVRPS